MNSRMNSRQAITLVFVLSCLCSANLLAQTPCSSCPPPAGGDEPCRGDASLCLEDGAACCSPIAWYGGAELTLLQPKLGAERPGCGYPSAG